MRWVCGTVRLQRRGRMKDSFLFLLFVIITQGTVFASERFDWKVDDYWRETKLDFESYLNPILRNANCKSSVQKFIGCVSVVKEIHKLKFKDQNLHLNTQNYDGFFIDHRNVSRLDYLKQLRRVVESHHESESLLFTSVDFEKYLVEFEKNTNEKNRSYYASMIYNEFLKVAVDPHSYIMPSNLMEDLSSSSREQKGIGVTLKKFEFNGIDKIIINEVLDNSPAESSGLQSGDIIISVNKEINFEGMFEELTSIDELDLTINRKDSILYIKMMRSVYKRENVRSHVFMEEGNSYGHIKLQSFSNNLSCFEVKKNILQMKKSFNIQGLVLDLRDNGGGLVTEAQCILSLFLAPGLKTWMARTLGEDTLFYDINTSLENSNVFQSKPVVVLINGNSASASEATAMYLQDYEKGFVVGERSFGKGSMQSIFVDENNPMILKAETTALYYGPKGVSPQLYGVSPDFVVDTDGNKLEGSTYFREQDQFAFPIKDKGSVDRLNLISHKRKTDNKNIQKCLREKSSLKDAVKRMTTSKQRVFDFQLAFAKQAIDCAARVVSLEQKLDLIVDKRFEMMSRKQYQMMLLRREQGIDFEPTIPSIEIDIDIDIELDLP